MSKAFTRESDDPAHDLPLVTRAPLPPGVKNYITPAGALRLRERLAALLAARASLTDPAAPTESHGRDPQVQQLREIIASLVVVEPPSGPADAVRFGARVAVRRQNQIITYRIVGVEETDLEKDEISWLSPLAKSLMGRRAGDRLVFRAPSGEETMEILSVEYAPRIPGFPNG